MSKLTVVIVNYNVKYFLEQCLHSVMNACKGLDIDVWVVDNNSVDGSVEMVRRRFPEVKCIANDKNLGFSKANNLAIRESSGEYVLLLNPDTVVEEDTFSKTIRFMDEHPDAGGLGVKMLDGSGKFLPESKRGLPTYDVAFYKMFGLSKIFPKSKVFGRYHLGFLPENEINTCDVLAGAFMMLRRSVLDKIGLLDEDFFMYGEDIDLSYRITKAGYKNYYFPDTRIIHYKGESTKKTSVNYVLVFYNAMIIFAKKHFTKSNASLFTVLIRLAIYMRAGAALISRFISKSFLPVCDFLLIFSGLIFLKNYWSVNFNIQYPDVFATLVIPSYCLVWLITVFFSGGYDVPVRLLKVVRGIISGTLMILVIYALLPEQWRYSRALILLGGLWAGVSSIGLRYLASIVFKGDFSLDGSAKKRLIIVGEEDEGLRVLSLLKLSDTYHNFIGFIKPGNDSKGIHPEYEKYFLGNTVQLDELTEIYNADEIIFCGRDVSSQEIIHYMATIRKREVEYKIAPPESLFIIGSSNVNNPGELYVIDINSINKPVNRRNKRVLDIFLSIGLLILSPLLILTQRQPGSFLANIFSVLSGQKSWVGYSSDDPALKTLPKLKKSVLTPVDGTTLSIADSLTVSRLNSLYAKDYRVYTDVSILKKGWRNLGRKSN